MLLIVHTLPSKTEPSGTSHFSETMLAGPDKRSVTTTFVAVLGPLLVTVIVYVISSPTKTVVSPSTTLVIVKSTTGLTVIFDSLVLDV